MGFEEWPCSVFVEVAKAEAHSAILVDLERLDADLREALRDF